MDQRVLNMAVGQVIEYGWLVSRREELRQFPEAEEAAPGNLLVFERKDGSRASSRNKSESHGNDTEQDLCKRRQRENSL